ncbi:MAG: NADH-quinone oxidoreductase subunit L [Candidatus Velamenicoccus archaeovorus]
MVAAEATLANPGILKYTWIVAVLPFASAGLILFFGKRTPGKGPIYGILALAAGAVISLSVLWHFVTGGEAYGSSVTWFQVGAFRVEIGQYVDGLTAVMISMVTVISLCIHVYSIGYMHDDKRYTWFFVVLSIFTGAMLNVVVADNLFQLLVGWEIMGICSYLLIGHWWEEHANSSAAIKAFITTKIGDVPFLFGIFALVFATGFATANIQQIGEMASHGDVSRGLLTAGALLLFGGSIGKSAQFPLHVWLPDAMAGPTPVSALIHAATMVAAGVYLIGRLFEVFLHADPVVLQIVGVVGGITALGSALLGLVQDDIKRVLAYSTISQLAYMVSLMSVGPAGRNAAFFHLFTHAFFKALLFLGSGSVIHAVHSNNMSEMGGLRKPMPVTFWTFLIGSAALAGIPPLAGFWSKDELLASASSGHPVVFLVLLVTALITAFYTTRMVLLTFSGEYRGHGHPHESPAVMTGPLVVLATATVGLGFLGAPFARAVFFKWVFFGEPEAIHFIAWVAGLSVLAAVGGVVAGYYVYREYREREPLTALGPLYTLLERRFYLDELYWKGIVRPTRDAVPAFVYWTNQVVLDGVVNAAGRLTRALAGVVNGFDRSVVDGAVNGLAQTAGFTGGLLRYLQSGNVQRYAAFLFTGVIILAIVFTRF